MNDYTSFKPPEPTWRWCFNGDWYNLTVNVVKPPCWFHRFAQRWVLGIHWEKI